MGPIASVAALTATAVNPIETEDCAALLLEMKSGALVTLSVTLGAEEEISRLRFCFAGLTVESHLDPYNPGRAPWRFPHRRRRAEESDRPDARRLKPGPERWTGQFARLHGALTEGTTLPVTGCRRPRLDRADHRRLPLGGDRRDGAAADRARTTPPMPAGGDRPRVGHRAGRFESRPAANVPTAARWDRRCRPGSPGRWLLPLSSCRRACRPGRRGQW